MAIPVHDDRQRILIYLKLLSSTAALDRLVDSSDPEVVADRLCSLWIDELYIPGLRYRDGKSLKADRTENTVRDFHAQFSSREVDLLEQFHRFLELRLEMRSKRPEAERAFPHGDFWQAIISHARRILEEMDPEGLEMDELVDRSQSLLWGRGPKRDQ